MSPDSSVVKVALMGATGTGKSTFINLLTKDTKIRIGHNPESETSDIQTAHYTDQETGRSVMLIDTPGFDDSREGVTDTDILEKIVRFLEPESGEGQKLNGILYLHRISDPRVGGVARKNLRMFQALCGEKTLRNVRIVTTFWNRVSEEEGNDRQFALEQSAFKSLLDAGAQMRPHANTVDSALDIMAELIPLPPVTTQIQEELQAGEKLEDTAAGSVLTQQIRELQKKHAQELAALKREMEEAWQTRDSALRAELQEERTALEEKMAIAEEDRRRLGRTLDQAREDLAAEQKALAALREETERESAALKALHQQAAQESERLRKEMESAAQRRENEIQAAENRHLKARRAAENRHRKAMSAAEGTRREQAHRQELERIEREARERERQLQADLKAANEKQDELRNKISQIDSDKKKIQSYADRGVFGRFFSDMGSVVEDCARDGGKAAGFLGGLTGALFGAAVSPAVALKRAVFGRNSR